MIPEIQHASAAFLQACAAHPPVETHISAVFVGKEKAWKLKKAVRLPFLDFSTPAQRRHFALREFTLNHPAAPELYLAVRGIAPAPDGQLQFCAADAPEAVEWVLEMAAIPADDFLNAVAARTALSESLCRDLGDLAARMHEAAPIISAQDSVSHIRHLIEDIAQNADAAGLHKPSILTWHSRSLELLQSHARLIESRSRTGHVRRVHGDLHLGNLCLWHGKVLPFDALEFDEALASIDTGYDLAFLLMDIEQRAGRAAANAVFNRYMARTGDVSLLPLLPLYLSLRAMIRAQISGLQNKPEHAAYTKAALDYLKPCPSPVIAIGGLQGTGKSSLARALAPGLGPSPGALVLRSDELRKRLHGLPPETALPQSAYTQPANIALNEALLATAGMAAASLHGLIIDASFLSIALREDMEANILSARRAWLGLWLEAPLPVLAARLRQRHGDASDAGPDVMYAAAKSDPDPITWHRLNAEDKDRLRAQALALAAQTA